MAKKPKSKKNTKANIKRNKTAKPKTAKSNLGSKKRAGKNYGTKHMSAKHAKPSRSQNINHKSKYERTMHFFFLIILGFVFLVILLGIYYSWPHKNIIDTKNINKITNDNKITEPEAKMLANMNCDQIKKFFGTNKQVFIYFVDNNGNVIKIDGKDKFGCDVGIGPLRTQ